MKISKLFPIFFIKLYCFIKTFILYKSTVHCLKLVKDPSKKNMLRMIEQGCILSFVIIGWWIPNKHKKETKLIA